MKKSNLLIQFRIIKYVIYVFIAVSIVLFAYNTLQANRSSKTGSVSQQLLGKWKLMSSQELDSGVQIYIPDTILIDSDWGFFLSTEKGGYEKFFYEIDETSETISLSNSRISNTSLSFSFIGDFSSVEFISDNVKAVYKRALILNWGLVFIVLLGFSFLQIYWVINRKLVENETNNKLLSTEMLTAKITRYVYNPIFFFLGAELAYFLSSRLLKFIFHPIGTSISIQIGIIAILFYNLAKKTRNGHLFYSVRFTFGGFGVTYLILGILFSIKEFLFL